MRDGGSSEDEKICDLEGPCQAKAPFMAVILPKWSDANPLVCFLACFLSPTSVQSSDSSFLLMESSRAEDAKARLHALLKDNPGAWAPAPGRMASNVQEVLEDLGVYGPMEWEDIPVGKRTWTIPIPLGGRLECKMDGNCMVISQLTAEELSANCMSSSSTASVKPEQTKFEPFYAGDSSTLELLETTILMHK